MYYVALAPAVVSAARLNFIVVQTVLLLVLLVVHHDEWLMPSAHFYMFKLY